MSKQQSNKSAGKTTRTTQKKKASKGLGDTIEKVTKATGVKSLVKFIAGEDCGCDERKERLNELFPYKKPDCMNENRYKQWTEFRANQSEVLLKADQKLIAHMHSELFNKPLYEPCTCTPKAWQKMIDDINAIYNTYESKEG